MRQVHPFVNWIGQQFLNKRTTGIAGLHQWIHLFHLGKAQYASATGIQQWETAKRHVQIPDYGQPAIIFIVVQVIILGKSAGIRIQVDTNIIEGQHPEYPIHVEDLVCLRRVVLQGIHQVH